MAHYKKPTQQRYDTYLRKFQYKNALDAALAVCCPISVKYLSYLSKTNNPVIVYSVISELMARRGLEIALAGRDEATLEPLFHYLISNITNPAYSVLLIDCSNTLFGISLRFSSSLSLSPC